MARGISFELPKDMSTKVLPRILENIDINSYEWINYLNQFECYSCQSNCEFHAKENYNGKELFSVVEDYECILFMKLQAFVNSDNVINCHTYEQFVQSDCEMLILICDVYYIDIYVKNNELLSKLKHNALKNGFLDITTITDENDSRRMLDVR